VLIYLYVRLSINSTYYMSIEQSTLDIKENKRMMQYVADEKSLKADIALHEALRKKDPTRVSEYEINQKKYELSQIERRTK
jgi:hypothetical protein